MSNLLYWVWLQGALGQGSRKSLALARALGSPAEVYRQRDDEQLLHGLELLSERERKALRAYPLEAARRVLEDCEHDGLQVVTPQSPSYPERLREIPNPPVALYVKGRLPRVDEEVMIAIVGTRKATGYGQEAAKRLSMRLSRAGAVIVSGGALGVDSKAHTGALLAQGTTVAVLGCGIGYPYLEDSRPMREEIARHGALVSEYPPGTPPGKSTFPCRNRLIAGLCLGTVVVEAGERSGSLITARLASEQGRDVFAIPGNVMSRSYTGTNRLLRDGAKPVYSALDVLEEYQSLFPHKLTLAGSGVLIGEHDPEDPVDEENAVPDQTEPGELSPATAARPTSMPSPAPFVRPAPPQGLVGPALAVYKAFEEEIMPFDLLVAHSGHLPGEVLRALTELELLGCVESAAGNRYRLLDEPMHDIL